MATEIKIITSRFPMETYHMIEQIAKKEDRSINWVVVNLIQSALAESKKKDTIATGVQER